jgi:predicted DNA-binding transcriptional regulator YafY
MKIDRLLGILVQLAEKQSVTAPELAEYFEVSRRTIIRDIDDLDKAGFPIVTRQGSGGGISLMEGFQFDKKLLKRDDLLNIVTGLKGLDSVSRSPRIELLLKRIGNTAESSISIDLASHYKDSLSRKIETLDQVVRNNRCVSFNYYSKKGESRRVVEPARILYQWSDWYLLANCRDRGDFRMFKLNRLWELDVLEDTFAPQTIPSDKQDPDSLFTDRQQCEVHFDSSVKYRLVESYGPESFSENDDGSLCFKRGFTDRDYIISWLLGFGDKAKVISPDSLVSEINGIVKKMIKKYSQI